MYLKEKICNISAFFHILSLYHKKFLGILKETDKDDIISFKEHCA